MDDIRPIPSGFADISKYNLFGQMITENGLPTFISFDNDLGEEKSGYDCAKWRVYYCFKNNLMRPEYSIHSMNPVGRENIDFIMKNKVKPFKLQKIITINQMSENDGLKSIQQIIELGKEFWVEDYQRGYRWTATEVTQLLEDINEFEGKEYCLQPVVVKAITHDKKEMIELIDGQQRMTTIFLIFKYLNKTNPFNITYATRAESGEFLNNIDSKKEDDSNTNIDYFHFYQAYQTIKEWFNKRESSKENFKDKLLNKCKVIWYEVPAGTDKAESIKIFTRINSGKIPLTNAELIKALFLINVADKKGDGDELLQLKQNEIA